MCIDPDGAALPLCASCYSWHLEQVRETFAPILPDLERMLHLALEGLPDLQDRARAFLLLLQWQALRRGEDDVLPIGQGQNSGDRLARRADRGLWLRGALERAHELAQAAGAEHLLERPRGRGMVAGGEGSECGEHEP
jgi:hypothetical protein